MRRTGNKIFKGRQLTIGMDLGDRWSFHCALEHGMPWSETPFYVFGQLLGGISGAVAAHLMFGLAIVSWSTHPRGGSAQVFSEFVATFGLISVVWVLRASSQRPFRLRSAHT